MCISLCFSFVFFIVLKFLWFCVIIFGLGVWGFGDLNGNVGLNMEGFIGW